MKIVVLAGGISTERDVSIVSGTGVCKALRQAGHQAILLDVFFGKESVQLEDAFPLTYDVDAEVAYINSFNSKVAAEKKRPVFFGPNVLELCQAADVVFLALHGENGENGKVQAAFDLFGITYTGTDYLSSAICMDKGLSKAMLSANGVPVPGGIVLNKGEENTDLTSHHMSLPVVVKPCCGGSSVGVYIVHTDEEYEQALTDAFSFEDQVVVEEYIEGREFSVGVIDGQALPIIEIAPIEGFYDYENKYKAGSTIETCPAELPAETTQAMQNYAVEGCKALLIRGYARLDFLMRADGSLYCLEANTLPGMTPTSLMPQEAAAMGIDYATLCEKLIEVSLKSNGTGGQA